MNAEMKLPKINTEIVQESSKEDIIQILKEENPFIQGNEIYSQLILVIETKKLRSNLGIIKGEYYQEDKIEYRGSIIIPLHFSDNNSIWAHLKEGENAFYGFMLDSREMKIPEKIMAFFNRSFEGATIQDFIPFTVGKRTE